MAIAYNPRVSTDGLLVYLDAANPRSYPGTGTTWTNLAGNSAYNGTLMNGPTFNSANKGVIVLDGADDWIHVPVDLRSVDYTIIGAARYVTIGGRTFSARLNNWLMGHWGGDTERHYSEGWVYYTPESPASDTNWRIYATTRNVNTNVEKFYVNGVAKTSTGDGYWGPHEFAIGSFGGSSEFSNSQISLFTVYNTILTDAQIMENFQALRGRFSI